jgi:hypothetical protein
VFCKYLGTDGLSERHDGTGSSYENVDTAHQLGRVTGLYSRFRPEVGNAEEEQGTNGSPFGLSPGRMLLLSGVVEYIRADMNGGRGNGTENAVMREVTLESYEDFSQLCVVANLVQVRPGTSLLLSALTIEDGFVRLWRDWLYRHSRRLKNAAEDVLEEGSEKVDGSSASDDILWVDTSKTVGLKMRVREKSWNPSLPVLIHQDDLDNNSWVGYEVILEGEFLQSCTESCTDYVELHIRSTRLLLVVEQSKEDQQRHQTNAIVIGAAPAPIVFIVTG